MITRETLKSFLRPAGGSSTTSADTISYAVEIDPTSNLISIEGNPDLTVDPNTGLPLIGVGETNGIAQNYVNYITSQIPAWANDFPIENTGPAEVAPPTSRGSALPPPEGSSGDQSVWSPSSAQPSRTDYFAESGTYVGMFIDKIGAVDGVSGAKTIAEVKPSQELADRIDGQSPAVPATFKMLAKYNKYTSISEGSDFIEPEINSRNADGAIRYSFQREKGTYQIAELNGTENSTAKTLSQLVQTAPSMLLKATGWDPSISAADSSNPNTFIENLDPEILSQYPNIVSMLGPDQVRARESYGAPKDGEASFLAGRNDVVEKDGSDAKYTKSNSTVYTPDSPFTDAIGMTPSSNPQVAIYQSAISMVALAIIIEDVLESNAKYFNDANMIRSGLGPFYMGRSTRQKADASLRAMTGIVIPNTGRYSYRRCVEEGLKLCLGIDINADGFSNIDTSAIEANGFINLSGVPETISKIVKGTEGLAINIAMASTKSDQAAATTQRLAMSWGFWGAVARSTVRIVKLFELSLSNGSVDYLATTLANLLKSKALAVTNVFAQIGYTKMIAYLGGDEGPAVNPETVSRHQDTAFSINSIETLPGTRIIKSRDPAGPSALSLAWRHSAVPSAFLLPPTLIAASIDMDYILEGPNPLKATIATSMKDKTYISARDKARIPIEVVNGLESRLDAEYVPFYFHDMRTNEVIGFHAFLESLTDNYTANFNQAQFHGRADSVKNYNNTKRSIGASFYVVSTSQEDFDEMWVKINKLITLLYPQYTKGTMMKTQGDAQEFFFNIGNFSTKDFRFEQPFSQVVGASPLIRLRIGDVIKSNYSRFALGRLFGAGNNEAGMSIKDFAPGASDFMNNKTNLTERKLLWPLLIGVASPIELFSDVFNVANPYIRFAGSLARDVLSDALLNGFVNPLVENYANGSRKQIEVDDFSGSDPFKNFLEESFFGNTFLKPRDEPYEFKTKDDASGTSETYVKLTRPAQVKIVGVVENKDPVGIRRNGLNQKKPTLIKVKIKYPDLIPASLTKSSNSPLGGGNSNAGLETQTCIVTLDDCLFDPNKYYNSVLIGAMELAKLNSVAGAASITGQIAGASLGALSATSGIPINSQIAYDFLGSLLRQFISPYQNPITSAIEGSMGRGLPGVITSMNFTWLDGSFPWDTRWNSRAPLACKITIAFDPVHDIAPGLDYYGYNRAPVYNVGAAMNAFTGDSHPDLGRKSAQYYDQYGDSVRSSWAKAFK